MACLVTSGDSGNQKGGTAPPSPLFAWPPRPAEAFKWLFGFPGYLLPWNIVYMVVATLTWHYLQPSLSRCVEFRADWILEIYVRNQSMLVIIVSAWHLRLWSLKSQGLKFKYTSDWMATGKRKFLWNNQLRDNVFWSCVSGGTIWTAYEVLMIWAYANEMIPYVDLRQEPVYLVVLLCSIQMWRLFHFYCTGPIVSCIGGCSTKLGTTSITKISTSDHGPDWPCTRLSTSSTSVAS